MSLKGKKQQVASRVKEALSRFHEWWAPLPRREKQMASVGAVAVVIFLLYQLIYSPLANQSIKLRKSIKSNMELLAFMQEADAKLTQLSGKEKSLSAVSSPVELLSILQQKVDKLGLSAGLTELKQAGPDSVNMQFKEIEFDRLMQLLIAVLKSHAVKVDKFSAIAAAQANPGIVNADVILKI